MSFPVVFPCSGPRRKLIPRQDYVCDCGSQSFILKQKVFFLDYYWLILRIEAKYVFDEIDFYAVSIRDKLVDRFAFSI